MEHQINYKITVVNKIVVKKEYFSTLCSDNCRNYNKKHTCPPHSGEFQINQWIPFYVVILWMPNTISSKNEYTKVKAINSILKSRLYRLLSQYPNNKVLGSGSCRLCKKCTYPEPCIHPDKMIYSMESVGIDVDLLCLSYGHKLCWYQKGKPKPYEYGSVVGLISDNNQDKIESRLRKILYDEPKQIMESIPIANTVII